MKLTVMVMGMVVMVVERRGRRGAKAAAATAQLVLLLLLMLLAVVAGRCQVQEQTGSRGVHATAGFSGRGVASGTAIGLRGQAHRRLRRVHGSRANERALHPTQLHAPSGAG